ncbi:MAG TPA: phosphoenolpyruvate carboxykinase (GTP) [Candidatus Nanoarchaeia archaeon]|nr:phosphoenolpyruvate carboxykinase (GTP) [Candidatus Nanoarchaeia archaeon]
MDTLDTQSRKKLEALNNPHAVKIVEDYISLCKPSKVAVLTDSAEDLAYIRKKALETQEEDSLRIRGHTVHFDGIQDQGRDLVNTRVLLPKGKQLSKSIETLERDTGLKEVMRLLDGIMKGKEMFVKFYCLGPVNSQFSIPALQITDSAYVVHAEDILYRQGYGQFKNLNGSSSFFHFVHAAGELDDRKVSKNVGQRRVYMDLEEERVFAINTQYAGNSVGLKKLALRLAISKANKEDWLCEHMFLMGVHPPGKKRVTYFTGAYPTACGKTSTAMVPGQSIIGDDIAYIRPDESGRATAVNVEQGIFGIIADINPTDDPLIYAALTTPRELIFSNILIADKHPYWLGMGKEPPNQGVNFSGEWQKGKKDAAGKEISFSHKNARYTIRISELGNADPHRDAPNGVPVSAFIYGGRDTDTSVPVLQSLSWPHGVFIGACLESETAAGTSEKEGTRKHNPMSNIEFLTVPLGVYIRNHLEFGERLDAPPLIFATNYFLQKDGNFLNEKTDKKVWLMWMEGRVHGEYDALATPVGFIPKYEDLHTLFRDIFKKEYTHKEYEHQFSIRISKLLERIARIEVAYAEENLPQLFHQHLDQQRKRLLEAKREFGDVVPPSSFSGQYS